MGPQRKGTMHNNSHHNTHLNLQFGAAAGSSEQNSCWTCGHGRFLIEILVALLLMSPCVPSGAWDQESCAMVGPRCFWDTTITNCRVRCDVGGVYIGLPEDATCHYVLHYPCQTALSVWVVCSDCVPYTDPNTTCLGTGVDAITWSIVSATLGFKITPNPFDSFQAYIEPAGSMAIITPGILTVKACGINGCKTGSITIEVDDCAGIAYGICISRPAVGDTTAVNGSVFSRFALGRYAFGKTAGNLRIQE